MSNVYKKHSHKTLWARAFAEWSPVSFKLNVITLDMAVWTKFCPIIEMSKAENNQQSYLMHLGTNCDVLT